MEEGIKRWWKKEVEDMGRVKTHEERAKKIIRRRNEQPKAESEIEKKIDESIRQPRQAPIVNTNFRAQQKKG